MINAQADHMFRFLRCLEQGSDVDIKAQIGKSC